MHPRLDKLPLFWRVFAANASLLARALAGLALAPVTVSAPVAASEPAVLAIGLAGLLVVDERPAGAHASRGGAPAGGT